METILLGYAIVAYVSLAVILIGCRHEIVMVHYRNPCKYTMEKIYMIIGALFIAAPLSIWWVLYEIWADKRANS